MGVCKDRFAVWKEDKRGRVGGRGGLSSKGRELDCVILIFIKRGVLLCMQ